MRFFAQVLASSAVLASANAQGVITKAQGARGSPASLPLLVNLAKADANIIKQDEIVANVVNECGRTLLSGNIDIGGETENQLANKTVTSVTKGSKVEVTISKVNTDGEGPYTCDMDQTSNGNGISGQTPLQVTERNNGNNIILSVTMPANMNCIGASPGNVCTVRCFNKAANGPFGGCFAVQQTDIRPNKNTATNIQTAQTLEGVLNQVSQNNQDFPASFKANNEAKDATDQAVKVVDALLKIDSTAAATAGAPASTNGAAAGNGKNNNGNNRNGKKKNNNNNNNNNRNGNAKKNTNGGAKQQRQQRRQAQWRA